MDYQNSVNQIDGLKDLTRDINGIDPTITNGFLAGLFGVLAVVIIVSLIIAIFMIIATWLVLKKGNRPGWAALIPIYREYELCKMTGVNPWWVLIFYLSFLLQLIPFIGSLVSLAVAIYFAILLNVSLARSFGKEDGFAVGLILLSIVFMPILAFGSSKYQGAKPMKDIIFKNYETENNGVKNTKFCTNCGEKVAENTKFCTKCGNEIK